MPSGAFERPFAGSHAAPDGKDAGQAKEAEPRHCILLRAGGLMSVLDMEQGAALLNLVPSFLKHTPCTTISDTSCPLGEQ